MFANKFQRIYYYHLKKCGGTTVIDWLSRQVRHERRWKKEWMQPFSDLILNEAKPTPRVNFRFIEEVFAERAHGCFRWADAIYDHTPLRAYAPPDTFSFTILRRPVERVISQVSDWRRLDVSQFPYLPRDVAAGMQSAKSLRLVDFLQRHARSTFRLVFDNYLTRSLAGARVGIGVIHEVAARELVDTALASLFHDFHVVGLTEQQAETLTIVASILGIPADTNIPRLNVSEPMRNPDDEIIEATDLLAELTAYDEVVYSQAYAQFKKYGPMTPDLLVFDEKHAAEAVGRLTPFEWRGYTAFSVEDAIIGAGFHGREGFHAGSSRLWTGPGPQSTIYMPVPVGVSLTAGIWVYGYAEESQRNRLCVEINNVKVQHRFETAQGWREFIAADVRTTRPFLKLTLNVGDTCGSMSDSRRRGINFDRYGWRVLAG